MASACMSLAGSAPSSPSMRGRKGLQLCWALALLVVAAGTAQAQQATQFLPSGLPAIAGGITARIVYRQNGFIDNWKDRTVNAVVLGGDFVLEPDYWRSQFAASGGVAHLGPNNTNGNFTITSGNTSSEDRRPALNFNGMANAVLVEPTGLLLFNNVRIADFAPVQAYTYTPSQPYINRGIGYGLWPTIALAPGALVYLDNVTAEYYNPEPLDSCEQFTTKTVFGFQQAFGANNVTATANRTAGRIIGPVNITVLVLDASDNRTVGNATAVYHNVTFACLPARSTQTVTSSAGGLSPDALAAAIAVPVAVVLAALILACCCIRRRNLRRHKAAAAAAQQERDKDLEVGPLDPAYSADIGRVQDQLGRESQGRRPSAGSYPTSANHSSNSTIRNFLAIPADTPLMEGILGTKQSVHSTGGSSSNSMRQMRAAVATGSSGVSVLTPVGSMPLGVLPSSSQLSHSQGPGDRQSPAHASAAAGTESSSLGPVHTGSKQGSSGSGQGAGSSGGKQTVAEKYAGITSLLKARSDIAVLRELKIGPLLGRGSYGRVYRGRWKATTVAVKIIEHVEGSPGTASSGGKKISVGRESTLATSISHPNVVQTYHISTMTAAQRSALANNWLADTSSGAAKPGGSSSPQQTQQEEGEDSSSDDNNSRSSIEAQQKNLLETWMIMEFCEKGSLERAVNQGRFIRRSDKQPEMVGIYKALLDTASGLDYLHSIGVVHGDLKTANVLLKGSAKDPRGFCCKITDFGLSRVLDLDATHISTATYGTIVYMPKELLLSGRMTQATDIYSFGLLMWELYTSSRVFDEGLSIGQMFYLIAYQNWRPEIPAGCPPGFAELMVACWHEEPEQRPTAPQLLRSLRKLYVQAKQGVAVNRQAEAAIAGASAAAAAKVLAGGASSSDSAGSAGRRPAAAAGSGEGASAPGSGSGGEAGAGTANKQQQQQQKAAVYAAGAASPFAGSDSSMVDSVVGALSVVGSGGQQRADGSGGLGLNMSGLTVSGGSDAKGSGGDDDGYRPFAAAVLQRKRSGSLATGSVTSGHPTPGHRSSAGRRECQQIQEAQRQAGLSGAAAAGGGPASAAASPGSRAAIASGATPPGSSEIEAFEDPIPSESLLENLTTNSNVQDGWGTEEEDECSGYLPAGAESGSQRGGRGAGGVELSSRANRTWAGESNRWGHAGSGTGQGPSELGQGGSSNRDSSSFRDSFSTGTMPSVMADSWLGSQSSRSLTSTGRMPSSMLSASGASMGHGSDGVAAAADGGQAVVGHQAAAGTFSQAGAAGVLAPSAGSRSHGALQTVLERSGSLNASEGATHSPDATALDARAAMAQGQQQAGVHAAQPPAGAPASPFAALATRAGSLFGPLKVLI